MTAIKKRSIYITKSDFKSIKCHLNFFNYFMSSSNKGFENIVRVEKKLDLTTIVSHENIPTDIVMVNSQVKLAEIKTGREIVFTLSLPEPANLSKHRMSIFSTIGSAVFACRYGDIIKCTLPEGFRSFVIKKTFNQSLTIEA